MRVEDQFSGKTVLQEALLPGPGGYTSRILLRYYDTRGNSSKPVAPHGNIIKMHSFTYHVDISHFSIKKCVA